MQLSLFTALLASAALLPHTLGLVANRAPNAPGPTACKALTTSLGSNKVVSSPLSLQFIASTHGYWNTEQSNYIPSCVVLPTSAQDVSTAIKAIRAAKSRFGVKAGGHNPNKFFNSVQAGVLIDLSKMTERTYDAATTLGTYQPGGTFGDIYQYFAPFKRTVVGARLAGVGTGLALGGGLSYLSSQYGLAADSFRELEVVIPDGTIVTASPSQNSDLFFACRGGGGNAYGIVTKYTVQTRPIGTFYAGNVIYAIEQLDPVVKAMKDFAKYNTDPKAAIIGTIEQLPVPQLVNGVNLDQAALMFLVYDGPDAKGAFDNFTAIPNLINTLGPKSYDQVVNLPIPFTTEIAEGNNVFRVGVHRLDDNSFENALSIFHKWAGDNVGKYELLSIDFQPIPRSLTDASNSQNGGNAMQMPDGPWFWLNYLIRTENLIPSVYNATQASFRDMVNSSGKAAGLPLFINDAAVDQNALTTFSTYSRLKSIKQKYDPTNYFTDYTGGWAFP